MLQYAEDAQHPARRAQWRSSGRHAANLLLNSANHGSHHRPETCLNTAIGDIGQRRRTRLPGSNHLNNSTRVVVVPIPQGEGLSQFRAVMIDWSMRVRRYQGAVEPAVCQLVIQLPRHAVCASALHRLQNVDLVVGHQLVASGIRLRRRLNDGRRHLCRRIQRKHPDPGI